MASVFIDGEAGTTGLGIRARLAELGGVEVRSIAPAHRKDAQARRDMMAAVDLAVLCLPDAAAREAVALADGLGTDAPRLLDASSAHRTADGWTYGFAELDQAQRQRITQATRVSNPGCYATGAVALLRPLLDVGLVPPDHPISINAVSGYSGGGHAMIEAHEAAGGPAFSLYGLSLEHKHAPEIQAHAGLSRRPLFVPSVGHFRQGMLVSIPLHLDTLPRRPNGRDLRAALAAHYVTKPRILIGGTPDSLDPAALAGTDRLQLFVLPNDGRRHALLVARLDNLGKGASGAAVQNIALMLGLDCAASRGEPEWGPD